jgi:hypothetical protein
MMTLVMTVMTTTRFALLVENGREKYDAMLHAAQESVTRYYLLRPRYCKTNPRHAGAIIVIFVDIMKKGAKKMYCSREGLISQLLPYDEMTQLLLALLVQL